MLQAEETKHRIVELLCAIAITRWCLEHCRRRGSDGGRSMIINVGYVTVGDVVRLNWLQSPSTTARNGLWKKPSPKMVDCLGFQWRIMRISMKIMSRKVWDIPWDTDHKWCWKIENCLQNDAKVCLNSKRLVQYHKIPDTENGCVYMCLIPWNDHVIGNMMTNHSSGVLPQFCSRPLFVEMKTNQGLLILYSFAFHKHSNIFQPFEFWSPAHAAHALQRTDAIHKLVLPVSKTTRALAWRCFKPDPITWR